jgi:hypothetical protein
MLIDRVSYWDHPAVSQSDLKLFDDSPYHFWAAKIAKITPPRDTASLRNGRALHALLFEPESFADRFPRFDKDLRSKDAKAEYAELQAQAESLDGCVIRDMDDVVGMASALRANRGFLKLLSLVTKAEFPVLWNCDETGVECRARIDAIGDRLVIDVKSIAKIPKRANLEKALAEYGYAFQSAHYLAAAKSIDGREREYWLPFVESKPPYAVACYPLGEASIEVEDKRRIALLTDLAMRRESGRWDFQEDVLPLELPEWHMRRIA